MSVSYRENHYVGISEKFYCIFPNVIMDDHIITKFLHDTGNVDKHLSYVKDLNPQS
jgi:hypothetical protein